MMDNQAENESDVAPAWPNPVVDYIFDDANRLLLQVTADSSAVRYVYDFGPDESEPINLHFSGSLDGQQTDSVDQG